MRCFNYLSLVVPDVDVPAVQADQDPRLCGMEIHTLDTITSIRKQILSQFIRSSPRELEWVPSFLVPDPTMNKYG